MIENEKENYTADVILLSKMETQGKETLRRRAEDFPASCPRRRLNSLRQVIDEYALLQWRASSLSACVRLGANSFVIRDGRIVMQSVYYALE